MSNQPSVFVAPGASLWWPFGCVIVEREDARATFSLVASWAWGAMCIAPSHGHAMFTLSTTQMPFANPGATGSNTQRVQDKPESMRIPSCL